jgi:hypothetical protein
MLNDTPTRIRTHQKTFKTITPYKSGSGCDQDQRIGLQLISMGPDSGSRIMIKILYADHTFV